VVQTLGSCGHTGAKLIDRFSPQLEQLALYAVRLEQGVTALRMSQRTAINLIEYPTVMQHLPAFQPERSQNLLRF
jgi:hypothetical protein